MGKEKCQSEVKHLLEKLISWREESNRQFSDIIDSHTSNINKGINDLAEEVCDLRAKLYIITKERNDLLENVDKLSSENKQLRGAIHVVQSLADPQESNHGVGSRNNQERPRLGCDQEQHIDSSEIEDSTDEQEDENPTDTQRISIGSTYNECTNADEINDIEIKDEALDDGEIDEIRGMDHAQEEQVSGNENNLTCLKNTQHLENHICPECSRVFSTGGNLRIHQIFHHPPNIHQKLELELTDRKQGKNLESRDKSDNVTVHKIKISKDLKSSNVKGGEKLKCVKCPYETCTKHHMTEHVKAEHGKIRKYSCEECGYGTSIISHLKRHMHSVHKMGEKKFKCNQCPHSSYQRVHLNIHIKAVHDKIRDQKCEYCEYASSQKNGLMRHKKYVHKIVKKS